MKSTYKLFGTIWDGMPDNTVPVIKDKVNLTDSNVVSFKSLLCASSDEDVANIINHLNNEKPVVLDIDYWCKTDNPIIKAFVSKRKRQIEMFLSSKAKAYG